MKRLVFLLIQLLTTLQGVHLWLIDCTYDNKTSHVQYICYKDNAMYNRNAFDNLCCNNHSARVAKEAVRIVTFRDCEHSNFQSFFELHDFKNLRVFNVSVGEMEGLHAPMFLHNLEIFIVSHNVIRKIPRKLFFFTPELTEIDLSYNRIKQLEPEVFAYTRKMKTIQIAHNLIRMLPAKLFSNLSDLEVLDVSHNHLELLDANLFISNKKLRILNLNNNQLVQLQCELLTTLKSYSLVVSFTSLVELETNCAYDGLIESNVVISANGSKHYSALTIAGGHFEWAFMRNTFIKIVHLNFESSNMMHIPALLEEANPELIALSLSNTFANAFNEKTLQRFTELHTLNMRRTNLSNVQFATILHHTNLRSLDLSYNNLKVFDFQLFGNIFQNLDIFYLEGNNLTELDGITHSHFPKLRTLAASKNRFTCHYLASFLHQWQDLYIISNPSSKRMQMAGIDCTHRNHSTDKIIYSGSVTGNCHSKELYVLNIVLIILIFIVCIYIIVTSDKCKPVKKLCKIRKNAEIANEHFLFKNEEHSEKYNEFENSLNDEPSIKVY